MALNIRNAEAERLAAAISKPILRPSFAWSRSKSIVAEILLGEPSAKHELRLLSKRTGVSIPQVSNVLQAFDERGWTERHGPKRGAGVWRTVENPGSMLESWAAHLVDAPRVRRLGHRVFGDPMQFLETDLVTVLRSKTSWAATGWAGAAIAAPLVTLTPVLHLYVAGENFEGIVDDIFRRARIRQVESGSNIEFWRAEGPLLLHAGTETRLPVINAPRLYSDLMALGDRAEDAAEHVRETVIGY